MILSEKEILFVCESFWPVVGGGERHAEDLSAAMRQIGWNIRVLTRQKESLWEKEDVRREVPVTRLGPIGSARYHKYLFGMHVASYLSKNREKIALVYVAGFRILGYPIVRAARKLGIPVILRAEACGEMSGDYIWNSPHTNNEKKWLRVVTKPLIQLRNRTLRKADSYLAIAKVIDDEFEKQGVDANIRTIIPNGIDFHRFHPASRDEKKSLRKSLTIPQEDFLFCYAGKLNHGKGLPTLIEAFALLKKRVNAQLLLIGSGGGMFLDCENQLREQVAQLNIQNSVHFTGYVDNVEDYLRASDAFVFPSEMEAFGLAPVEAAACGLPLISTTAGALQETMREDETARTFPIGDIEKLAKAMEQTMTESDKSIELANRAYREFSDSYSMDSVVSQHAKLFRSLIPKA